VAEGIGIGIRRHRYPCLAMGMIRWVDSYATCSDRSPRILPLVGRIIRLPVPKPKFSQKDDVNNSTLFVAGTEEDERMSRLIGQETLELKSRQQELYNMLMAAPYLYLMEI
jgi:hypothetical protein